MSSLFYPHRNHHRSYGSPHYHLTPYGRQPTSFTASPWNDPFNFDQPFHAPFLSLFNDTFSQLDRLSNELNGRLNEDSDFGKLLTLAPKFDIKETEKEFILEGELPGVEKKDISLDFVDDNTLILKTRTEKVREEGAKPQDQSQGRIEGDAQMSGANQETSQGDSQANGAKAQAQDKPSDTTAVTTTNQNKELATPTTQYHLTERSVGTFQRAFSLPGDLKHEEVKASLKNGVLTVTVPKVTPEAKEDKKKSRSVTVEEAPADEDAKVKQN